MAKSADELASLLEKVYDLGGAPEALISVRELLRATVPKETGNNGTEAMLWAAGMQEEALAGNSHAWSKAPSLAECLRVVARQANGIRAGLPINLVEAISSQKSDPAWEYVRNLWALLRDNGFRPSYPLAEAIVCTVIALDLKSDIDASNVHKLLTVETVD